jgi:hypothetical protein
LGNGNKFSVQKEAGIRIKCAAPLRLDLSSK